VVRTVLRTMNHHGAPPRPVARDLFREFLEDDDEDNSSDLEYEAQYAWYHIVWPQQQELPDVEEDPDPSDE